MSGSPSEPARHLKRTKQNEAEDSKVLKIARLAPDYERLVDSSASIEIQEARVPKRATSPENTSDLLFLTEGESSYASEQTARDITKSRDSLQSLDEVKTGTSLLKAASINTGPSVTENAELSPEICLGMVQIKHPFCSELSCIVNWSRYSGPRLRMLTEPHLMRPVSKMCSLETPNISD